MKYCDNSRYDISKVSNARDYEKILALSEEIENLTKDNYIKDRQIKELEDQIEFYGNLVTDNCVTISEVNSKNKKEA